MKSEGSLQIIFQSASAKILDFLCLNDEEDYSESEIARRANVSLRSVQREIPKLQSFGLVKIRRVGRAKLCKLNISSITGVRLKSLVLNSNNIQRKISQEEKRSRRALRLFGPPLKRNR